MSTIRQRYVSAIIGGLLGLALAGTATAITATAAADSPVAVHLADAGTTGTVPAPGDSHWG